MSYEVELPYSPKSSTLTVPVRVRERHLTPETRDAHVQEVGRYLRITIWSERDNITIHVPLTEWSTGKEMQRRLSGANNGLISVGRFEDRLEVEDGSVTAEVDTHTMEEP